MKPGNQFLPLPQPPGPHHRAGRALPLPFQAAGDSLSPLIHVVTESLSRPCLSLASSHCITGPVMPTTGCCACHLDPPVRWFRSCHARPAAFNPLLSGEQRTSRQVPTSIHLQLQDLKELVLLLFFPVVETSQIQVLLVLGHVVT